MADNKLKRTESYQYPSGHLGHLSGNQQSSLDQFKQLCHEKGYYKPAGVDGRALPSHDDETLLRYLRARKFVPQEAFIQFKDTEDWRRNNQLEELYETMDINEYEETRKLYPQWTGRRDKRGMPVYLFEVAHLSGKNIAAYEASTSKAPQITSKVPVKMLRLFALYESMCRFVLPLCSAIPNRPHQETPISQSNNIVDISKVGLKQFWNLKNHMQDASILATAHYPETLDRIFIIGAPSFFPTVWGWIKRWFDPITVSKIFILSNSNMKSTLEKYIDPENIPKKYGGQLDFQFGMMPVLEPTIQKSLKWNPEAKSSSQKSFPIGPINWQQTANGEMEAVAIGSVGGKPRKEPVAIMNPGQQWEAKTELLAVPTITNSHNPMNDSTPSEIYRTTTGDHTHPPPGTGAEADLEKEEPPPEYVEGNGSAADLPPEKAQVPDTSRRGTYTVPVHTSDGAISPFSPYGTDAKSPPQSSSNREGTSETRFEQQSPTHAAGVLAKGTPAVRDHGYGDRTSTMEPKTVGQAPKEVPRPEVPEDGEGSEGNGYVAKAQAAASSAYQEAGRLVGEAEKAVRGAVGMEKGEEGKGEKMETPRAIDSGAEDVKETHVEEYLRSTVQSQSPPASAQ